MKLQWWPCEVELKTPTIVFCLSPGSVFLWTFWINKTSRIILDVFRKFSMHHCKKNWTNFALHAVFEAPAYNSISLPNWIAAFHQSCDKWLFRSPSLGGNLLSPPSSPSPMAQKRRCQKIKEIKWKLTAISQTRVSQATRQIRRCKPPASSFFLSPPSAENQVEIANFHPTSRTNFGARGLTFPTRWTWRLYVGQRS